MPIAQEIIQKYASHPRCLNEDSILPIITNQKMNSYLIDSILCGVTFLIFLNTNKLNIKANQWFSALYFLTAFRKHTFIY